jgi:hypothetical protein
MRLGVDVGATTRAGRSRGGGQGAPDDGDVDREHPRSSEG